MPVACYCKKCKVEVPVGETCAQCGGKLTKASQRLSFQQRRTPWRDWMKWNEILRIVLPVWLLVALIVMGVECLAVGWEAAACLLTGETGLALLVALGGICGFIGLWLAAAGQEVHYYFLDQKGAHQCVYLPNPTVVKRWARLIFHSAQPDDTYGLFAGQSQVSWPSVKRVQIWHEKNRILLYAPTWWMQLAICCPPEQFQEAVAYVQSKLSKRKDVRFQHTPPELASEELSS